MQASEISHPKLPCHLPDIQFGGGLQKGEKYLLTDSQVRFGISVNYLAIKVEGQRGPLRKGYWPIREGHVVEDAAFLSDADYLALYLNLVWQLDQKKVQWNQIKDLIQEVEAGLELRNTRVLLT